MEEIEKKLTDLIGQTNNGELMDLWLDYLLQNKESRQRIEARIEKKDPFIMGALIGAFIGSLFSDEKPVKK